MKRPSLETTPGRLVVESFLRSHESSQRALEIGAADACCRRIFPNLVTINIHANPCVDIQADVYTLPFPPNVFDVAICAEVLEHLHTPEAALCEIQRVLRPGGKLLLTTPFAFPIHDAPLDYYRYTRYGLAHLLGDWRIESLIETTTDGTMLATYLHYWLFKKKGLSWKVPKLIWWGCWQLLTRSDRIIREKIDSKDQSAMPTGYVVVAFKR